MTRRGGIASLQDWLEREKPRTARHRLLPAHEITITEMLDPQSVHEINRSSQVENKA